MSFAIYNVFHAVKGTEGDTPVKINFALLDSALVIIFSLGATLLLAHAFGNHLPIGLSNGLGIGTASLAGLVILSGAAVTIVVKIRQSKIEALSAAQQEQEAEATPDRSELSEEKIIELKMETHARTLIDESTPSMSKEAIQAELRAAPANLKAKAVSREQYLFSRVANGLFLGGIKCIPQFGSEFQGVVTVAPPYVKLADEASWIHDEIRIEAMEELLKEIPLGWHYVGRMISDRSDHSWETLVHDCTFSSDDVRALEEGLGLEALVENGRSLDASIRQNPEAEHLCQQLNAKKKEKIESTDVLTWFEPVFKAMRESINQGQKVLVHCSLGRSRSSSLVAAFLIKEFGATVEEAEAFLKLKRPEVNLKNFSKGLKAYEVALYPERASK